MHIPVPKRGPIEWNLNTVIVVIGFAFTWGVTYQGLADGRMANANNIQRLEARITTLETTNRILDNHELRIQAVERQAAEAAATLRALDVAISGLASDIRLTREILERVEQRSRRPG